MQHIDNRADMNIRSIKSIRSIRNREVRGRVSAGQTRAQQTDNKLMYLVFTCLHLVGAEKGRERKGKKGKRGRLKMHGGRHGHAHGVRLPVSAGNQTQLRIQIQYRTF